MKKNKQIKKTYGAKGEVYLDDVFKEAIGIGVKVTLAEPYSLPRSEGKAVRVIDNRDFS